MKATDMPTFVLLVIVSITASGFNVVSTMAPSEVVCNRMGQRAVEALHQEGIVALYGCANLKQAGQPI